jgi:transposase InsO family protein
VYPNLAQYLILTEANQLWVADMTYLRLQSEFVYLAVVLDAFSRRAVGWALGRNLHTALPLTALEKAIANRRRASCIIPTADLRTPAMRTWPGWRVWGRFSV